MNLKEANLEDLVAIYCTGTSAMSAVTKLLKLIEGKQHLQLAALLRDYRQRGVFDPDEIAMRAAVDRLLTCYAVMEVAALAGFVPDLERTECGRQAHIVLENKQVRRYYEEFYPQRLPQLFRCRVAGRGVKAPRNRPGQEAEMLAFLELDRRFMEKLEDGKLLRMLDSFTIDGWRFRHIAEIMGQPSEFIDHILRPPKERDVRSLVLHQFTIFMQFCFDLHALLSRVKEPLLRSAMWNHYGYWFDIIGEQLHAQLDEALSRFLEWKPERKHKETATAIQAYVRPARKVLKDLTSQKYSKPVDDQVREIETVRSPVRKRKPTPKPVRKPAPAPPVPREPTVWESERIRKLLWDTLRAIGQLPPGIPPAEIPQRRIEILALWQEPEPTDAMRAEAGSIARSIDQRFVYSGAEYFGGSDGAGARHQMAECLMHRDAPLTHLADVAEHNYTFGQ